MSENQQLIPQEQEQQQPVETAFNLGRRIKLGGLTLLVSLVLDVLLNGSFTNLGGQTGLWLSVIATLAAFVEANPIVEQIEELPPVRYLASRKREVPKGELPWWKRGLGISEQESLPVDEGIDGNAASFPEDEDGGDEDTAFFPSFATESGNEDEEAQQADAPPVSPFALPPLPAFPAFGMPVQRAKSREREVLLAENLGLDINAVIDAGVFVAGMKGSGKSSLAARLMEQVARFPIPQVIFDLKGDFVSLADAHCAGRALLMQAGYIPPADYVLANRACVIVDLRTWNTWNERAALVGAYCRDLLAAAMALPEGRRVPWFVHLDEAQQFVAQARPHELSEGAWRAAKDAVANLGALGRAYGAVPCLYTQRIAAIHKDTIAQVSLLVFMKAALSNDLDRYEEYLGKQPIARAQIAAFGAGEAAILLPDGTLAQVQCLPRQSRHGSHTPHIEQAWHAAREPETSPAVPVVRAGMARDRAGHPLRAKRQGNGSGREQWGPVRAALTSRPPHLLRAAQHWNGGANSIRKLMLAEGINFNQARRLKEELEQAGFIECKAPEA